MSLLDTELLDTEYSQPPTKRQKLHPTSKPETTIITLEEYGDLYLHVGADHAEQPTTFLVCSKTVSRLSKVMNCLLYGGFVESKKPDDAEEPWEVELPSDDPVTLRILLGIMHGKFEEMPQNPDLPEMLSILVTVDKYDCFRLLRPWSRSWIRAVDLDDEEEDGLLLGIAWHLGDAKLFETITKRIAESSTVSDDKQLLYGEPNDDDTVPFLSEVLLGSVPLSVHASILDLRQRLIDSHLTPYAKLHKSLLKGSRCRFHSLDKSAMGLKARKACDDQLLGSLTKSLFRKGINIMADEPQQAYRGNYTKLKSILKGLALVVGDAREAECWTWGHEWDCGQRLLGIRLRAERNTYKILDQFCLMPQHETHLRERSQETGLDEEDEGNN